MSYRSYWSRAILELLKESRESISIKEITDATMIKNDDVISTLQQLDLIKYHKGQHVLCATPEVPQFRIPLFFSFLFLPENTNEREKDISLLECISERGYGFLMRGFYLFIYLYYNIWDVYCCYRQLIEYHLKKLGKAGIKVNAKKLIWTPYNHNI